MNNVANPIYEMGSNLMIPEVMVNPIYAMGSNAMISDTTWLRAQAKLYQEIGVEAYFDKLFEVLDELSIMSSDETIEITKSVEKTNCLNIGPFRYFPQLLGKCKRKFAVLVN